MTKISFDSTAWPPSRSASKYVHASTLQFIGGYPRQSHQVIAAPPDQLEAFRITVSRDVNRRVRLLMRFGIDVKLGVAVVLAVPLELTTRQARTTISRASGVLAAPCPSRR